MKMRSFRKEDVKGKKVLLRVDFNVPLKDGKVTDTTRIEAHMKTLEALLGSGAKVALASHLGRPKGKRVPEMSLSLVAPEAEKLYGVPVVFCDECVGPKVKEAMASLPKGSVLVLENLRFHAEEQENDRTFAENLAAPFDVFVMDAFSASHRADASTNGITEFLPSFSG
ncbi:MAG: phosphoglycerate kinase, partial [Synergistales bacterium]|nr:phosphoglycerate kinase [Synergistales bacterium]